MSGKMHIFFDAEGTLYGLRSGKTSSDFWKGERTLQRAKEYFEPFPDVPSFLRSLRTRGHRLYVLSRNVEEVLLPLLSHFGLREFFDDVVIEENKGKYLTDFRRRMGLDGNEILMIGDTFELDVHPVLERGMKAVHVNRQSHPWPTCAVRDIEPILARCPASCSSRTTDNKSD